MIIENKFQKRREDRFKKEEKEEEGFDKDSCNDRVNSFPWVSRVEWPHVRVYRP